MFEEKHKKELWKTIIWVSKYYICSIGNVLQATINYQHKKNYNYVRKNYDLLSDKKNLLLFYFEGNDFTFPINNYELLNNYEQN